MDDGVRKLPAADLVWRSLGIQREVDAVLLQEEREMEARRTGSDDPDAHVTLRSGLAAEARSYLDPPWSSHALRRILSESVRGLR